MFARRHSGGDREARGLRGRRRNHGGRVHDQPPLPALEQPETKPDSPVLCSSPDHCVSQQHGTAYFFPPFCAGAHGSPFQVALIAIQKGPRRGGDNSETSTFFSATLSIIATLGLAAI